MCALRKIHGISPVMGKSRVGCKKSPASLYHGSNSSLERNCTHGCVTSQYTTHILWYMHQMECVQVDVYIPKMCMCMVPEPRFDLLALNWGY